MEVMEIKARVKEIIANVTSIDPESIEDGASFTQEMGLDSLSLLEVGVDVDYEFKLELPEESMRGLDSVDQTVALVQDRLAEQGRLRAEVA
jgi:acyl carrier protein